MTIWVRLIAIFGNFLVKIRVDTPTPTFQGFGLSGTNPVALVVKDCGFVFDQPNLHFKLGVDSLLNSDRYFQLTLHKKAPDNWNRYEFESHLSVP